MAASLVAAVQRLGLRSPSFRFMVALLLLLMLLFVSALTVTGCSPVFRLPSCGLRLWSCPRSPSAWLTSPSAAPRTDRPSARRAGAEPDYPRPNAVDLYREDELQGFWQSGPSPVPVPRVICSLHRPAHPSIRSTHCFRLGPATNLTADFVGLAP
jgi:hypothetical protein